MKKLLAAVALTSLAAGCGYNTSVSLRVGAASGGAALDVGNGITIERLRMVVRAVEFEKGDEQNEIEVESGPYLIDLSGEALNGGVHETFAVSVPADTYDELEFEVHKIEDTTPAEGALLEMRNAGASISIDGTIDGVAFTFVSAVNDKQELNGVFTIAEGANNVTLNVDPSGWFTAIGGARLDPRDDQSRGQIEENIKLSIDAFDDDDHDGSDDASAQ